MAETPEGGILEALEGRLQSLPSSIAFPISWEGKPFTVPASKKYLRTIYSPNVTNRVFIGSTEPHQHLGIFQINLHWPHGDFGRIPRDAAGKVAAHYPADLVLTADGIAVRVTAKPFVAPTQTGTADVQVPILIPYEAWA